MLVLAIPTGVLTAVVNEKGEKALSAPDKASRVLSTWQSAVIYLLSISLIFSLSLISAMKKSFISLILPCLYSRGLPNWA